MRLIFIVDALQNKHLPVAGGIYDQHPDFLDALLLVAERRGHYQEKERKDQEAQAKKEQTKAKTARRARAR